MEIRIQNPFYQISYKHIFYAVIVFFVFTGCLIFFKTPLKLTLNEYQEVYKTYSKGASVYRVGIIADLDKASKMDKTYRSVMILGKILKQSNGKYVFEKESEFNLTLPINEKGRGMELSDLVYFNGELYSFDDRSGLVVAIDIEKKKVYPKHILMDGNLRSDKGMKIEWATVKDDKMYIGSIGKEFTTPTGEYLNDNPLFVKTIDTEGRIGVENWKEKFTAAKNAIGITGEGYMIHEAIVYNPQDKKWYISPRKCSTERYDDEKDETRGCPYIISTKDFKRFDAIKDPQHDLNKGFSSIKYVPNNEDKFVYLKSVEVGERSETYIGMISKQGNVLMDDTLIAKMKMEGIEFIPL